MEKKEILQLETRRQIYNYIVENPGVHLRKITRSLKMNYHNIDYHINYLKKLGMISIKSDDSYSRVYPSDSIGTREKEIIDVFRRKTTRYIIIFMFASVVSSQEEISKNLEKDPKTINFHIKKLIKLDLIEKTKSKDGITFTNHPSGRDIRRSPRTREALYRLKNYTMIRRVCIRYKKSLFEDEIFKKCIEFLEFMTKNGDEFRKKTKYMRTLDWHIEANLKLLEELFPIPICA